MNVNRNEAKKVMTKQNTRTFHKGWTRRLREAILANDVVAMDMALVRKADPDGKIADVGMSFLDHAAAHHMPFGVAQLLEYGATADAERVRHLALTKGEAWFPIHCATMAGLTNALNRLLHAGANVDELCSSSQSALFLAACHGLADTVRLLLAAGADIEHRQDRGPTPLWGACKARKVDVVRVLLEAGAKLVAEVRMEGMDDGQTMSFTEMVSTCPDDIKSLVYRHKAMRSASALKRTLAQPTPSATARRARM